MTDTQLRPMGRSGVHASAIGLGTWAIGGTFWGGTDEQDSIRAIQASIDSGVSLIDTAPGYGNGLAEELVGKAIKGRRDAVVIATKCGLNWHHGKGGFFFEQQGERIHRYLGRDGIRYEVEQSLRRLGTETIDLYITHWQDPTTPVAETMETLLDLKREGKIKAIGISNATPADLDTYLAVGQVDAIQESYSMLDRGVEATLLPICAKNDVAMLSYSSLALGLLTGTVSPQRQFKDDDLRKDNPRFSAQNRRHVAAFAAAVAPIARAHGATIAQLVIAWTIAQRGITYALCGARNAGQAIENALAGKLKLTPDELLQIDDAIAEHLGNVRS